MPGGREDLGEAVLDLTTDPTKLRQGMTAARQETTATLNSAQDTLRNIGTKMTATGGQMTRGITVPVIAAGAAIVSVGADFEHSLSEIVGLVGVNREQINKWRPEIEALAISTGIGPRELAKGLYFVASSGIDASKAMDVLTIAARASEAGMGDVSMLADVLTAAMNAYAKSNLTAAHTMDVLVRGIQVGKAEPADFASSLGQVAPQAALLGVSIEDLVGTMAVLSRVNSNVAENATSLGQVFNTLLKPTGQTNDALAKMGLNADDLRKELKDKGLLAVLKTLGDHISGDDEAIAHIFPNIRALRGVLNLTGQDAGSVADAMAKVADSSGALDDAVTAVSDDASVKLNKALASLQVELVVLSADVLPVVVRMLSGVVSAVHDGVTWFSALPGPVKDTAITALALLAVLGPILVILGSIITAASTVGGAFGTLATFMTATLIPRFTAFIALLATTAIQAFATVLFATGIPALEALAVALLSLETAAAPLLLIAGAIAAIAAVASQSAPSIDELRTRIEKLAATDPNNPHLPAARAQLEALTKAQLEAAQAAQARVNAEIAAGDEASNAIKAGMDKEQEAIYSHAEGIRAAAYDTAAPIAAAPKAAGARAVAAVTQSLADIARAIRDGRQAIVDAMNQTVTDAYDPLILAAEISATKVELADQQKIASAKAYTQAEIDNAKSHAKTAAQRAAADAMHTKDEIDQARLRVLELRKQLATQLNDQTKYGTDAQRLALLAGRATSKELVDGLKSGDVARQKASQAAAADIASGIVALEKSAGTYGTRTGNAYVDGLIQTLEDRLEEVRRAHQKIANLFVASSPPGPESPMHLIDVWGRKTGEAFMGPLAAAIANGRDAVRRALGGIAGDLVGGTPGGPLALGRIERMGTIRVEHDLTPATVERLAAAGFDSHQVGQALADGISASGLFGHLQSLQALSS